MGALNMVLEGPSASSFMADFFLFLASWASASSIVFRLGPDFMGGFFAFTMSAHSVFLKPPFSKQGKSQSQIAQRLLPSLRTRVTLRNTAIVLSECRIEFIHVCSPRL